MLYARLILATCLAVTVTAQNQIPLKDKASDLWNNVKSYIPSASESTTSDAADIITSAYPVEKINVRNYQRKLAPKPDGEEEWLVYMTGGNKSCLGNCADSDLAWIQSLPLLSSLPQSSSSPTLHLAKINCEVESALCAALGSICPSIWHFQLPRLQEKPYHAPARSPLHIVQLNATRPDPIYIASLPLAAEGAALRDGQQYDGLLHPIDGALAKLGLLTPFGYFVHFLGTTPSWMIMIAISFLSRQFMTKKAIARTKGPDIYAGGAGQPAAAATPAAASTPATATGKSSGSASKSGRKRK